MSNLNPKVSMDDLEKEGKFTHSILNLCSICSHHKEKSLFCNRGFLQDKSFCRNFNSFKIKFFVRRWEKESKKTREIYLGSKCIDHAKMVKLYSILYKVKEKRHGIIG